MPISLMRWQIYTQLDKSLAMQQQFGLTDGESDEFRVSGTLGPACGWRARPTRSAAERHPGRVRGLVRTSARDRSTCCWKRTRGCWA